MLKEICLKNFKCFREETTFPLSTINLLTGINGRGKSTLLQSMLLMKQSVEHNEYTNKLILNGNCVNLGTYEDLKNSENALEEEVEIYFDYENKRIEGTTNTKYMVSNITSEISRVEILFKYELLEEPEEYRDVLIRTNPPSHYRNKLCFRGSLVWGTSSEEVDGYKKTELNHFKEKVYIAPNLIELKSLLPNISDAEIDIHSDYSEDSVTFYQYIRYMNFYNEIHYIAADRLGSQEYYKKINLNDFISVDKKGENLATVLFELKEELVNDKLYLGKRINRLEDQVGEWLSKIFDTEVEIKVEEGSYIYEILFTIKEKEYKPTNVGFGYSYILPIIVSGLIAKEGEILIIENPEAHLHPKAQSELTKFLAKVASCGVQIFIESHSEHILNGLQVTAKQEEFEITNEDVNILYFHDNEDTYFTQIPVKPNGKIEVWKDGFFDQSEKDLDTILGL
ncbi:DUF3696 domain-containing protein [Bernardetia sp. OM2101]|uniref:AAA family ATPase n=1 Tax=Bernardetia sp. OM2101 TaxID=3344876 RepID=UPI0035CF84D4